MKDIHTIVRKVAAIEQLALTTLHLKTASALGFLAKKVLSSKIEPALDFPNVKSVSRFLLRETVLSSHVLQDGL